MKAILLYAVAAVVLLASCKKIAEDPTVAIKKSLIGVWRQVGHGNDNNSDLFLQEEERGPQPPDQDMRITFKEDGSCAYYSRNYNSSINLKATWSLIDTSRITLFVPGYDTIHYGIDSITRDNLFLIDDAPATERRSWTILGRE